MMRISDYIFASAPLLAAICAQVGTIWRPSKFWAYGGLTVTISALAVGLISLVDVVPASGFVRALGSPYGITLRSEVALIVLISSAMLAVFWLAILVNWQRSRRRNEVIRSTRTQHGDARFARWSEVQHMADQPGFILGEWSRASEKLAAELGADANAGRGDSGEIMRWSGAGSLLSFSPPDGGKTSSMVIPTLIDYPGPVVVNDVKGENAAVTVRTRRLRGHRVAIINPYAIPQLGVETDSINVMDFLRYGTGNFATNCKHLAASVVEKSKSGANNPHFEEMAIALLSGVISFLVDANQRWVWPVLENKSGDGNIISVPMSPLPPSLAGVYDFFNIDASGALNENLLDSVFAAIAVDKRRIGGRLATAASVAWNKLNQSDEKASHFSTLTRFLGCFGDDAIRQVCGNSTINLDDLFSDTAPLDIFICIPPTQINGCAAFVRALFATITSHVLNSGTPPPRDVLLLLDEMPVLGALDAIMNTSGTGALALGRSAGLRIWAIVQSLSQLKSIYGPDGQQTWLASSSVVSFTKISAFDAETQEYVSKILGSYTVSVDDVSESKSGRGLETANQSRSKSERDAARALLRLEEVSQLPDNFVIATALNNGAAGNRPLLLQKIKYWERPEWQGRTDKNPFLRVQAQPVN